MLLDALASALWSQPNLERPSCCAPRDANHRGPEMLLARGGRGGELLGASEATCPGGAPCHDVRACTELQFGPVEDEVTLHDHWRSEDTKTREQSARTSVWGVVEGDEEEEENEERSGTVVGTRTTRTTRTLKTPDMRKGIDHKVHQESTKSTSLPAESLASTAKGSRVNWNQDEVEDTSPKTPKTPNSGHRSMTSRSSRSSYSNLSENARRAAATRAAMAQLHIDLEDPDGQSEGRSAGGGSVLARAASAVSRMLRAGSSLSSMLGATSRTTQRMPTLTSISQRRTLASMVSFRLNSPQLLRATRAYKPLVNLGAVLRDRRSTRVGFGRSLIGQAMASAENVVRHTESFDDYMLSFQTREIDQFWSHSWRANTFLKVMVLLLYYNQAPAAFFSILSGGVGMALRALHILPYFVKLESAVVGGTYLYAAWTSIFGLTAFLSVLFLWRPKQRVFLDKVCIHQKDPVLKKEGVESIGAFLYYSQTMLVLWDPSYATRLWCVFEMAAFAWAHRNDLKNRVEIRPVIFAPVYFGLMVTSVINWALLTMFPRTPTMSITVWPALQSIICILGVHFLRSFHRDMTILRQHLAEFQAANAQCYCCSVSHRLPETGERIACDREVIQACIMTWFGTLTDFDSFVQAELAGYFWRSLGHFGLPYRWVLGSQLPVLWAYMDIVADSIQGGDVWYISSMVIEGLAMWLCASPLVVAFVIWVTNLLQRKRKLAVCDTLVSLWAASLALIPVGTLTFLWYVSRFAISPTNPLPGAIVFLIVTAEVTTLTYKWGRSNCFACG
ncbi:unnamed protein product [Symbiodinium sp. CCMP2592]|nr:unnamed protein product [Symbiodinium sp. CCMP2592]